MPFGRRVPCFLEVSPGLSSLAINILIHGNSLAEDDQQPFTTTTRTQWANGAKITRIDVDATLK